MLECIRMLWYPVPSSLLVPRIGTGQIDLPPGRLCAGSAGQRTGRVQQLSRRGDELASAASLPCTRLRCTWSAASAAAHADEAAALRWAAAEVPASAFTRLRSFADFFFG